MGALSSLVRTFVSGVVFGFVLLFASGGFMGRDNGSGFTRATASGSRMGSDLGLRRGDGIYSDRYWVVYLIVLFLTAAACSVGVIYIANRAGWARVGPRSQARYGWFEYDGNVLGGMVQGFGMAMTRAEPGLVFVRAGMGWIDAWWMILGGVLGGLSFVLVNEKLKRKVDTGKAEKRSLTLHDGLGISMRSGVVGYEMIAACVVVLLSLYLMEVEGDHEGKCMTAIIGGTSLGFAQLASILLTKGTIGVSSAYPSFAVHVLRILGGTKPHPGYASLAFACGLLMSGTCVSTVHASVRDVAHDRLEQGVAVLGGFLMIFGSRIAGGCTSGHGISGCGTLSISSFVTLAAIIAGVAMWATATS